MTESVSLHLIRQQSKLILHHTACCQGRWFVSLPVSLSVFRWISSCLSPQTAHMPAGRSVAEISSRTEKSASSWGEGLMSARLIADYGAAACWEHTLLRGSGKFFCMQTHTNTQARAPSLPITNRIHQHVKTQMNIKPSPRGAAPLSPGSTTWHSAHCLLSCGQGNYPACGVYIGACAGVYGLH